MVPKRQEAAGVPYATVFDNPLYVACGTPRCPIHRQKMYHLPLLLIPISSNSPSLLARVPLCTHLVLHPSDHHPLSRITVARLHLRSFHLLCFGLLNSVLPSLASFPFPRLQPCLSLNRTFLSIIPHHLTPLSHARGTNNGCTFMTPRAFLPLSLVHRDGGRISS